MKTHKFLFPCYRSPFQHGPRRVHAFDGHGTDELRTSGSTPAEQRPEQGRGPDYGPAIHAAVKSDLRLLDAVGQSERGGRHAGALPFHHRLARSSAGNEEASGGQ